MANVLRYVASLIAGFLIYYIGTVIGVSTVYIVIAILVISGLIILGT